MYERNQIRIRKFDVNFCIKHVAVHLNYPLILRCSISQGKNQSSGNFFLSPLKYDPKILMILRLDPNNKIRWMR